MMLSVWRLKRSVHFANFLTVMDTFSNNGSNLKSFHHLADPDLEEEDAAVTDVPFFFFSSQRRISSGPTLQDKYCLQRVLSL